MFTTHQKANCVREHFTPFRFYSFLNQSAKFSQMGTPLAVVKVTFGHKGRAKIHSPIKTKRVN